MLGEIKPFSHQEQPPAPRAETVAHTLLAAISFSGQTIERETQPTLVSDPVKLFGGEYVELLAGEPERIEQLVRLANRVQSPTRFKTVIVEAVDIKDPQTRLRIQCEKYLDAIRAAYRLQPQSLHYEDYLIASAAL